MAEIIALIILCLVPVVAGAGETEFHEVYSMWTIFWVSAWSICGFIVSYAARLGRGEIKRIKLMEFVGEMVTAGFAGWITFILGRKSGLDIDIVYGMAGVAGHMGTRTMFFLEKFVQRFFDFLAYKLLPRKDVEEYNELFNGDEDGTDTESGSAAKSPSDNQGV
ncbi:phage holin family protein [Oxalobacter sp. OttesenSCG-928-P03]|nr:phage holin family protein [Oxalobacter sp. OttesenSCG-928-P03]